MKIVEFLKKNWLVVILAAVIVALLTRGSSSYYGVGTTSMVDTYGGAPAATYNMAKTAGLGMPSPIREVAPSAQTNRLVVTNTNLSLKVNDVRKAIDGIVSETRSLGGFMVNSNLDQPEGAASGQVTVRIPSDKLEEGLAAIRALGVKVVSENVNGTDVTDQYVDLAARLETLNKTKVKFEEILAAATRVPDLLEVQQQLVNIQNQIDSVVGQQKYLEQTAKLSLLTVYLATDELALPYAPAQPWRPDVVFKTAVRSLIGNLRNVGSVLIYIAVYAPIWVPVLGLLWWLRRTKKV